MLSLEIGDFQFLPVPLSGTGEPGVDCATVASAPPWGAEGRIASLYARFGDFR